MTLPINPPSGPVTLTANARTVLEKRYLINGSQMLTGYYFLRRTRILVDAEAIEVLELHSDTLFPATLEGNGARSLERAEFQQVQAWFDSRWEMVATALPLDE